MGVLSAFLPWDFSPTVLVVTLLAVVCFSRGARRLRAPIGQRAKFYLSVLLIYGALQTRWDYYAGHMFFVHRLQHFVLHDAGPFLLAWSAPAPIWAHGLPSVIMARLTDLQPRLRPLSRLVLDPWTATAMFIASLCLWVLPQLHFYAMLSNWLYTLMNWSVVVLDLPFWWLILDPRPYPQARLGQGARILMLVLVMLPMILVGAMIGLARHDLYPVYQLCGRFFPLSPITDQQLGGLIIWILGSFLAVIAALIALSRLLEEARVRELRSGFGPSFARTARS